MMKRAALWKALTRRRFSMSMNNRQAEVKRKKEKDKMLNRRGLKGLTFYFLLLTFAFTAGCGVRFDMQDQPRYKALKKSEFFKDGKAMRELPEGTVARGLLKENKAF